MISRGMLSNRTILSVLMHIPLMMDFFLPHLSFFRSSLFFKIYNIFIVTFLLSKFYTNVFECGCCHRHSAIFCSLYISSLSNFICGIYRLIFENECLLPYERQKEAISFFGKFSHKNFPHRLNWSRNYGTLYIFISI